MGNIANFILTLAAEGITLQLVVTHGGEYFTAKLVDVNASLTDGPLFDANGEHELVGRDESMGDAVAQLEQICAL